MRRIRTAIGLAVLVGLAVALATGSAAAGGPKKMVEGTVYDTTCATPCMPECPPIPCGPVTQSDASKLVCAQRQRMIVCPLRNPARICLQGNPCGGIVYPVYVGEGAVVKVRRRGSVSVPATLPVVEGHFKIALGNGEYVFHPYLPEEPCWSGKLGRVKVFPQEQGPIPLQLLVDDSCVAQPDRGPWREG